MQKPVVSETTKRVMPGNFARHVIRLPYNCNFGGLALSGSVSINAIAGTLVLAPQATRSRLLAVVLRALGKIALLLVLLDLLLGLLGPLVAVLDYLPGDALAAEAERYGRRQRHATQEDPTGHLRSRALYGRPIISTSFLRRSTSTSTTIMQM